MPNEEPPLTLEEEVSAVREVLGGLMALWREGESADDARKLAALVFSGARTVALLLAHQVRLGATAPDNSWLDAVLEEMRREGEEGPL